MDSGGYLPLGLCGRGRREAHLGTGWLQDVVFHPLNQAVCMAVAKD